ncbi:hypothetical protein Ntsu_55160 [Nocardia sp. IFM 10818]
MPVLPFGGVEFEQFAGRGFVGDVILGVREQQFPEGVKPSRYALPLWVMIAVTRSGLREAMLRPMGAP